MKRTRFNCWILFAAATCSLAANSSTWAATLNGKPLLIGQGLTQGPSDQHRLIPGADIAPVDPHYGQAHPEEESPKTKDITPHQLKVTPRVKETAPDQESPKIKDFRTTPKAKETNKTQEVAKEVPVKEIPIENVVAVTTEQLVNKPQEYLNKNVKFTAPFFAYSNLALDYKPAFRSSRTYLSFLVLRPNTHTPFSEIKLALLVPKEKDPQTKLLQTLKEGDVIEITGKVFACPLDEPWLDVLRLKRIGTNIKKGTTAEEKSADDKDSSDEKDE